MKAVTWQGREQVSVENLPDPAIHDPHDAVIRVTSTAICGSDLHLYDVLTMYMEKGDVLGHEAMGVVEEVGSEVTQVGPGDRVVVPFNIACGHCAMCGEQLYAHCETTQNRDHGTGASLFGYSKLYGQVPGGQAQYLRVPFASFGLLKVPTEAPDERYLFLSDVLPTAWQAVEYAAIPPDGAVVVLGLGPIGQMSSRIAAQRGAGAVIGVDLVPERLEMAARHGVTTLDLREGHLEDRVRDLTDGRGPHAVIDAVGMEAHGDGLAAKAQAATSLLPDVVAQPAVEKAGVDRLAALLTAIDLVRRGGTVSIIGVYGGAQDPLPMMRLFDKGVQLRMGQAHVRRWAPDILPLLDERDPLGTADLRTHRLPLEEAPTAYSLFQRKEDGCIKVVLDPWAG